MKSPERQLTEWAVGAITYDYGDDPDIVMRVYTQAGWTRYCTRLLAISGVQLGKEDIAQDIQHDVKNNLERCLFALTQLVGNIGSFTEVAPIVTLAYKKSHDVRDLDLCDRWTEFVKVFFDPKRMLRYESAVQVLLDLRARLSEALSNALSIHSLTAPQA